MTRCILFSVIICTSFQRTDTSKTRAFLWRYAPVPYGVPAPFFQSKEEKLFVMYIINKSVIFG